MTFPACALCGTDDAAQFLPVHVVTERIAKRDGNRKVLTLCTSCIDVLGVPSRLFFKIERTKRVP